MTNIVRVASPINIAAGLFCSFMHAGHTIGFVAPVDFMAGDSIAVDTRSGQPLAVQRNGSIVWQYTPEPAHGVLSGKVDAAGLEALLGAMGMK